MGRDAFVVVFLKPEIATGFFKFAPSDWDNKADDGDNTSTLTAVNSSSIPGVSADEAAFLLPNGKIIPTLMSRIKERGFEIIKQRMNQLTKAEARYLFSYEQQHRFNDDEQAFAAFLNAITSGPSLALVLKLPATLALGDANAAIKKWVELAGDWDPVVARKKALAASIPHDQWPLRALCGFTPIQNGISSSPHVCCSRRERFFLMPPASPQLERATIVLLPSFQANVPNGKEFLLSTIARASRAIIMESFERYALTDEQIITLCGLTRILDGGLIQQTCAKVVQLAHQIIGTKGVDVFVLEGLDLTYTLRFAVGPANVELARLYFPESVRGQVSSKQQSVELPAGLHPNEAADDDAFGFESGLFLSFDQELDIIDTVQKGTPIESTLGLIKPNATCNPEVVAEILRVINGFGFTVERQRRLQLSRDQAGAFYAEHRGKSFFETLVGFMTSGEIVALYLSRPHAIKAWRGLMGPTNSMKAHETYPWTLRARFGIDGTRNATHGSDSTASAARELCFFFGSAVSASSTTSKTSSTAFLSAQTMAQRSLVLSGTTESSVENVLTQGLKELVDKKVSDPLEACRWLGQWLVTYRYCGLEEESEMKDEAQVQSHGRKPNIKVKRAAERGNTLNNRKVVAITLDASINSDLRSAVLDTLRKHLKEARYEIIDVATEFKKYTALDVAVAKLVEALKACGRRRCVLFGCDEFTQNSVFHREFKTQAPVDWQINCLVCLDLHGNAANSATYSLSFELPVLHFRLPSTPDNPQELLKDKALHGLFQAVFDPNVVLLADPEKLVPVTVWTEVATHFGFHLLTFDAFLALVKNSNDDSDDTRLLLELSRSGSKVPPTMLLTVLRRVLVGSLPGSSFGLKFLLLGFPWSDIQAEDLEQALGRPESVLFISKKGPRFQPQTSSSPLWLTAFRKQGLMRRVSLDATDRVAVCSAVQNSLLPIVGCYLGQCDRQEELELLQITTKIQGFVWVDCSIHGIPSVQKVSEVVLCAYSGREKFFLYGYPQTCAQAVDFLNLVGSPQFVLHKSSSTSPVAEELLAVFDAHPTISQLDLASSTNAQASNSASKLRSTIFRKQVVAVVGNVDMLQLPQLREVVAPLGYHVIDFKHAQVGHQRDGDGSPQDDHKEQLSYLERQVEAVQAPRCLVVGAPESPSFYHALEARIGCAMHHILVLQQAQVRVRDAMHDNDSDDDSDEEQGNVHVEATNDKNRDDNAPPTRRAIRWRKVMQALSPQLSELVQTFALASDSSISIDVLGFLENTPRGSCQVVDDLVTRLRPRLFGVVGHPFSMYQTVARGFCRRHSVGFVDLTTVSSSLEALEQLETLIATTPHSVYCLDGFPRSSLPDANTPSKSMMCSTPRYVAQQLWELDRRLGTLTTLVHFTTALEVLEERTPEQVTRRMLDNAQDDLELASADLLRWFKTGQTRHQTINEVTCDQTLEDAQVEMDRILLQVLRPNRPAIKQVISR